VTYRARIYFEDEAPRIGMGWRTVAVKVGRKWLHLTCAASGRTQRLPVSMLQKLKPQRLDNSDQMPT